MPSSRVIQATSRAAIGLVVALSGVGCDSWTDVRVTDVVTPGSLENATGAAVLHAGAVGSFADAFSNGFLAHFLISGLVADEFVIGPPFGGWLATSRRTLPDPADVYVQTNYIEIHGARISAMNAIEGLQAYAPDPRSRIGHMFAYVAYSEIFLGESWCSGIPLSSLVNQEPEFGPQLTTAEMFERALAEFDLALENAGTSVSVQNLAKVGRGRALLNLGRFSEAASSVADVPTDFLYEVQPSALTPAAQNGYYRTAQSRYVNAVDRKGDNGLDYISANDPRVALELSGEASGGHPWYYLTQYMEAGAPVELASGIEARLIEAEAAFNANPDDASPAGSGWLGILNQLRETAINPPLSALDDPGTREVRVDLLFRERAFWTYATGRRHGDMRRLVRQYGRTVESVFPVGIDHHGIAYGDDVNIAPPVAQFANPNYTGCLSRDP